MSGNWLTMRAWLLMLPLLLVMLAVIGWPLVDTVHLSFTNAKLVGTQGSFIGFDNYLKLLVEPHLPAHALDHHDLCRVLGHRRDGDRRSRRAAAQSGLQGPHLVAGPADPALGAADRGQRHAVAADLQSRIRRPQRRPDPARIARCLSVLARRTGLRSWPR